MILTEAKKRAQREFDEVLAKSGLDAASLRAAYEVNRDLRRATFPVPHSGVAGTAANTLLHLAAGKS
jgi:hypothetical protein